MLTFLKRKETCYFSRYYTKIYESHSLCAATHNLKGGMLCSDANKHISAWQNLVHKLTLIGLRPLAVGGSGDCFFKAVSHQLYGKPDLHYEIRIAGVHHMINHPSGCVVYIGC